MLILVEIREIGKIIIIIIRKLSIINIAASLRIERCFPRVKKKKKCLCLMFKCHKPNGCWVKKKVKEGKMHKYILRSIAIGKKKKVYLLQVKTAE